ncbi:MAG TPA: DUF4268 domain-containing protein [Ferruginibacter sp.]|nr:DUF4268 domain-containing protein [Ferruginibacter sp.]
MYTKEQASKLRAEFWTTFGRYMQPVPSASGGRVHWVNYKTGVKKIRFALDVENKQATVSVILIETQTPLKEKMFDVLRLMQEEMNSGSSIEWLTDTAYWKNDTCLMRLFAFLPDVNLYNTNHWPQIISFFKAAMIAIDAAWVNYQPVLEMMVEA